MLDSYYTYLNFPIDMPGLVLKINEHIRQNVDKFYHSRSNQFRIDFNTELNDIINEIMPFRVSDAGVFRNVPKSIYPLHKDSHRRFAVNMQLVDNHPDFDVGFVNDDKTESFPIPYVKNQFVLINTQHFHYIKNNSDSEDRYCVSIGCTTDNYSTIRKVFEIQNRIGLYQYN